MEKSNILQSLGLAPRENAVYLTLLERGPLLIADIAKITGLHRPTIYKTLPGLQGKQLVSVTPKGKQKRYVAETPEKLRAVFERFRENFEQALPDLQRAYDIQKRKPLVKFVEGKNGLTFITDDLLHTLKRGGIYYKYTTKRASISARKYLQRHFYADRDAKQLQRFMITDELADWQKKPDMNRLAKIIPQRYGLLDDNLMQVIYGDKVAVADFETETAFIIESPLFATLQRKIFKALFDLL